MACIVCIAILIAVGVATGMTVEDRLDRKLADLAESGERVHETDSVAVWDGKLRAILDDGTVKVVDVTVRMYKGTDRVAIQINDHGLTQREAERLEDDVAAALGAAIAERRFPPVGPDGLPLAAEGHDHGMGEGVGDEDLLDGEEDPGLLEAEDPDAARRTRRR
ncbi:MAG: hypothetical protein FDZ70_06715 [Actinobacteria bacterium]|nr:MAG: hypothetical protein FDZ70_06715 [Actinomycetota bacterium]